MDFERILRLPPDCRAESFVAGGTTLLLRLRNVLKVLVGVDTLLVFGGLELVEFVEGIEAPEFWAGGALEGPLNIFFILSNIPPSLILYWLFFIIYPCVFYSFYFFVVYYALF